jgi:spore germination protein KC
MGKRGILLGLFLIILILLGGCGDSLELDDSAHVLSVAIDKGQEKAYRYTFQMPILLGEGLGNGEARFRSLTLEADNILDAFESANHADARNMNFAHLNFLVVSEELARKGDMPGLIASCAYLAELREEALVVVARGSAQDFLKGFENEKESNLERLQENLIQGAANSSIIPSATVADLLEYFTDGRGDCVVALGSVNESVPSPATGKGEEPAEGAFSQSAMDDPVGEISREGGLGSDLKGAALFSDGKMVEVLGPGETKFLLMARGEFSHTRYVVPDPAGEGTVTLNLTKRTQPDVQVHFGENGAECLITVFIRGRVVDQTNFVNMDDDAVFEAVTHAAELELNRRMEEVRAKALAAGSDAFNLSRWASRRYLSFSDYEKDGVKDAVRNGQVRVQIEFQMVKQDPYRR